MTKSGTSAAARIAALVTGLAILGIVAFVSVGLALAAPIAIWLAVRIQRARGRTMGLGDSWIAAVSGVAIASLLVAGIVASRVSTDTWHHIRHAADSASTTAARRPPPAWLTRLAPATSRPALASREPPALQTAMMFWGMGIVIGMLGGLLGSVGWVATILLMFCASGRWPGTPQPVEFEPSAA